MEGNTIYEEERTSSMFVRPFGQNYGKTIKKG